MWQDCLYTIPLPQATEHGNTVWNWFMFQWVHREIDPSLRISSRNPQGEDVLSHPWQLIFTMHIQTSQPVLPLSRCLDGCTLSCFVLDSFLIHTSYLSLDTFHRYKKSSQWPLPPLEKYLLKVTDHSLLLMQWSWGGLGVSYQHNLYVWQILSFKLWNATLANNAIFSVQCSTSK